MKASEVPTYYESGRYTTGDLESFFSKDSIKYHNQLVIAGFSCRPVDEDDGRGVNYTLGCGCCSLDLRYRMKPNGWRASTYVTSAGTISGDSKINDEFASDPQAAIANLLTRLEDESELGPVEERGYIHAAHEAIEEALEDWLGEDEDEGDENGED